MDTTTTTTNMREVILELLADGGKTVNQLTNYIHTAVRHRIPGLGKKAPRDTVRVRLKRLLRQNRIVTTGDGIFSLSPAPPAAIIGKMVRKALSTKKLLKLGKTSLFRFVKETRPDLELPNASSDFKMAVGNLSSGQKKKKWKLAFKSARNERGLSPRDIHRLIQIDEHEEHLAVSRESLMTTLKQMREEKTIVQLC